MNEIVDAIARDSVGLGVLLLTLIGLYRLANRAMGIFEIGVNKFLIDFERIADGIADIAKRPPTR